MNPGSTSSAARFVIRARLTAFSGFTEGGALPANNYQKVREKYLKIDVGDDLTMSDIYKRANNMTINGTKTEIHLPERAYFRYSLDGGTTTTGNLQRNYNPYNITINKEGYEPWSSIINITEETSLFVVIGKEISVNTTSNPGTGSWGEEKEETITQKQPPTDDNRIKKIIITACCVTGALLLIIIILIIT